MQTKQCNKCRELKPISNFWKDNITYDGLFRTCKECSAVIKKDYYAKNKNRFREHGKEYYKKVIIEKSIYYMCYRTIYSHKRKGYIVDITIPELITMADNIHRCPMCNIKLNKELGNRSCQQNSLSFDCINNKKEFIRGNIQVLCSRCNSIKRGKEIHIPEIFSNMYKLTIKALTKKEELTIEQRDLLEKCLIMFRN